MILICCPVFSFLLVFQHVEVRAIAWLADIMFFYSFPYGAAWFLTVSAVAITAVCREFEYLWEIVPYLFLFHIECAKTFDSRCIDNISVSRNGKHFREGGGVHTFIMIDGNFTGFYLLVRQYRIDKGWLSYTGMSGEKCYPTFQFFLNLFYTLTCFGRNFKTGIADGSIEIDKSVQIVKLILIISICFIKDYLNGYAVCLSRSQKAVDESSGGCLLYTSPSPRD